MPFAATLTGQWTLPVDSPALAAAPHSIGTFTSCAYQYQPPWLICIGSKLLLLTMPCLPGDTPVISVVWLG